jgi:hypothetical protein
MRTPALVSLAVPTAILLAVPATAQDVDAMAKWTAASVVHYKLVGDFTGEGRILETPAGSATAPVTDHVEIELDWNQTSYTLAGDPVIRNAPSKVGPLAFGAGCPAPRADGAFEFATVTGVTALSTRLQFDARQERPAGTVPTARDMETGKCGEIWVKAEPGAETLTFSLDLPPAMLLAAPGMGGDIEVTPDGKSMAVKPSSQTSEWGWTITPTIVR